MVKFHHSFADGVGLVSTLTAISDNYDKNNLFENAPALSLFKNLLAHLVCPIYIVWALIEP